MLILQIIILKNHSKLRFVRKVRIVSQISTLKSRTKIIIIIIRNVTSKYHCCTLGTHQKPVHITHVRCKVRVYFFIYFILFTAITLLSRFRNNNRVQLGDDNIFLFIFLSLKL